jgi:LPS export ABC transporter protein LptC
MIAMLVLLAAAAGSWTLLFRTRETPLPAAAPAWPDIGYYAREARLSGTDDDGRILYRVTAATVEQSPAEGGDVKLQQVAVEYAPAASDPWELRADEGTIPPGGKIIRLAGNVVATSRPGASTPAIIRTDQLEFDTVSDVATTASTVHLDYAGSVVEGVGMRAELARSRLELLASVRGTYAP